MTPNSAFVARTCIVGGAVTNESNMAFYFTEARNLNGSNADIVLMCLGRRVAAPAICLTVYPVHPVLLQFPPLLALLAATLYLNVTTIPILPRGVLRHYAYLLENDRVLVALVRDLRTFFIISRDFIQVKVKQDLIQAKID